MDQYLETAQINQLSFNGSFRNTFSALSLNIRSIVKTENFNKLEAFLANMEFKPDIISITETWIKQSSTGPFKNLEGYQFVSNCRKDCNGGGVAFYVKNGISFYMCDDLTIMNEREFESLFIKITLSKDTLMCGTIYRAPQNDNDSHQRFLNTLNDCLKKIDLTTRCFLYGDYNYDLAKIAEKSNVNDFVELMADHSFFSIINKPTRITDTCATVLDHIWTNSFSTITKCAVITHPLSDHMPVVMCASTERDNAKACTFERRFTNKAMESFFNNLENIQVDEFTNETRAPDCVYEKFIDKYMYVFNESFPLMKKKLHHPKNNWFDRELKELLIKKEKLLKKFCAQKNIFTKTRFNKARNEYFRAIKIKKQAYYASLFKKQNNNLKQTWRAINNLLGKAKPKSCSSLKINNQIVNDVKPITNHFNQYFSNVGYALREKLPQSCCDFKTYLPKSSSKSLYLNPVTPMEVKRVITELKSKHSCGLDGISTRILKLCPDNIALILAHIFNLSLSEGVFLKAFKQAKVIPVFKKGSTYDVNNYRPISLLPVMSKVLEKLVYTRLVSFLNRKGFFHEMQFGFRPNHSTSHATTLLIEKITEAFEAKQAMVGVFLDLSKAFDTIDHDILLSKLFHYGIRGIPYDWFKSYLTNRQQQVMCQNVLSNVKYINIGVPQGSILGPLLF